MTDENVNPTESENTESATPEATAEGQGPTLSIVDVRNAVNIIDFACNQGAFKGWDTIVQVMNVRNNLKAFVDAVAPAEENAESDEGARDSAEDNTPEGGNTDAPSNG